MPSMKRMSKSRLFVDAEIDVTHLLPSQVDSLFKLVFDFFTKTQISWVLYSSDDQLTAAVASSYIDLPRNSTPQTAICVSLGGLYFGPASTTICLLPISDIVQYAQSCKFHHPS